MDMQQINMDRLIDPETLPLNDTRKECTSHDPNYPACHRWLPLAMFGTNHKHNPRCLFCRHWEGLFNELVTDIRRNNFGKVYFEFDRRRRRELFYGLTNLVAKDYKDAMDEGDEALAKKLWPIWRARCIDFTEEWSNTKRRRGLFVADKSIKAQRWLYMAAWIDYPGSLIQDGYVFGKAQNVFKRWATYNFKNSAIYFGPLLAWDIGPETSNVERAIKQSGYVERKEIIHLHFDDAHALMQRYIDSAGVDAQPTFYHGQIANRKVLPATVVDALTTAYRFQDRLL
jgi:hypothetical protein